MRSDERTLYYKCNMTKTQHILFYVLFSILGAVIAYLFYHLIIISVIIGLGVGFYFEKVYAQSTITKRQRALRTQFRSFLDSMAVAVRAGNVEYKAVQFALDDLQLTYSEATDIVVEVKNILIQYEKGGIKLTDLFNDLAERSDLDDIRNFATVYSVIEGKSDRFGEILVYTEHIISEKIGIEQEIETTVTAAKTETNTMMLMPIVVVIMLALMGGGMMDALFTTSTGHIAATVSLILYMIAYAISVRVSKIEV